MSEINCWLQSSLERVFPNTPAIANNNIDITSARGERLSFQACVRNSTINAKPVVLSVDGPDEIAVRIRRVGYVPVAHHSTDTDASELDGVGQIPGMVPDPLFDGNEVLVGPYETAAFWVNVTAPRDINPGVRELTVRFTSNDEIISELKAIVDVRSLVVEPRKDFPVTHWFYADAICDWYKVEPFDEKFWQIVKPYIQDIVDHGNNGIYVPIFTPPTDGVKRPTQLLIVSETSPGKYSFDFSKVRKWVTLAKECGAQYFEWTHLFWQWGVKHALRIYKDNADRESLLWPPETGATSDIYRNFLSQFLPEFKKFLDDEGLIDCSLFHLSDEPGHDHLDNYKAARELLREVAPWMKVMDALSEVDFAKEGLTDIPIPSIGAAHKFAAEGIEAWTYFCCGPRGPFLNRFVDTPLAKIRISGWLFYHLNAHGFLHWGYNYWYKSQTQSLIDPFVEQAAYAWPGWAYGDPFVVYPGPDGPLDSIRWEVFFESLQDYALLQSAGIDPDDPILSGLKSYSDFPKTRDWVTAMRAKIL